MRRLNSLPGNWQSQGIIFLVTLVVAATDQLSKLLVRNNLAIGQSKPEEGILRLTYVTNDGIVFGIHAHQILSIVIPIIVVIVAIFLYYRYILLSSKLVKTGLGLIISGSIGNLIDRIRFGYVIDFIDIRLWGDFHWPVFNLADTALISGVILLIYFLLRLNTFQNIDLDKE